MSKSKLSDTLENFTPIQWKDLAKYSRQQVLLIDKIKVLESHLRKAEDFLEDLKYRAYVPPWLITGLNSALYGGAADTETNNGTVKEVPIETGEEKK